MSENATTETPRRRRTMKVGVVTSDKMEKSVVVRVDRIEKHKMYKRYVKRSARFMAHDEENQCHVGPPLAAGVVQEFAIVIDRAGGGYGRRILENRFVPVFVRSGGALVKQHVTVTALLEQAGDLKRELLQTAPEPH